MLLTFGLGTALGDTTATNLDLGYWWSVVVFSVLMVVPIVIVFVIFQRYIVQGFTMSGLK